MTWNVVLAYVECMWYVAYCFWHMYGSNMWSIISSWLFFRTFMLPISAVYASTIQSYLNLQRGSHICWVIYAISMKCSLWSMCIIPLFGRLMLLPSYVGHISKYILHIGPWKMCHLCLAYISGNKMYSICCSRLCFATFMHQCCIHMLIQNDGCHTCSMIYGNSIKCSLQEMCIFLVSW